MPEEGVEWKPRNEILSLEEVEMLVRLFVRLGVNKVRLTGGEPTVRKGYVQLVASLGKVVPVHLTTNGTLLTDHANDLVSAGLSSVNVSCDSLQAERFADVTRRDALDLVISGIESAIDAGIQTKLNVVVMRGFNEDEIPSFIDFAAEHGIEVRFIEFMPFLGNQWKPDLVVPHRDLLNTASEHRSLVAISSHSNDVAQSYIIEGTKGRVGFISSVTDSFCGGCNRLRLTADGQLKTCLFLPPRSSLRDLLRSGASAEAIVRTIKDDLNTKWEAHPPMHRWAQTDILSMVQIGG